MVISNSKEFSGGPLCLIYQGIQLVMDGLCPTLFARFGKGIQKRMRGLTSMDGASLVVSGSLVRRPQE
jgi:hypothetical protein